MGTGRCITINFTAVDNKYPNTDEEQGGKVFKRYNLLSKEETGQRHPEYRDGKTVYGHFSHRVIFKQRVQGLNAAVENKRHIDQKHCGFHSKAIYMTAKGEPYCNKENAPDKI